MSMVFVYTKIKYQNSSFSSIWSIDRTLSCATTLVKSELGSDGNEGAFCIPQSSSITGTSPSDNLVSCPGHSLSGSYSSAEVHTVYSTVPVVWATRAHVGGVSYPFAAKQSVYSTASPLWSGEDSRVQVFVWKRTIVIVLFLLKNIHELFNAKAILVEV